MGEQPEASQWAPEPSNPIPIMKTVTWNALSIKSRSAIWLLAMTSWQQSQWKPRMLQVFSALDFLPLKCTDHSCPISFSHCSTLFYSLTSRPLQKVHHSSCNFIRHLTTKCVFIFNYLFISNIYYYVGDDSFNLNSSVLDM